MAVTLQDNIRREDFELGFLLKYENIAWYEDGCVIILDRRIYPMEVRYERCYSYMEVAQCIADMVTQSGGPYVAAAMGMALAAYEAKEKKENEYMKYICDAAYALSHARPTTTEKMVSIVNGCIKVVKNAEVQGQNRQKIVELLVSHAIEGINLKYKKYKLIASYLAKLIPTRGTIMTQCYAETVIGCLLRECKKNKNDIKIICPETRPYLQGARLTASLCRDMDFDVTVITDNMPAFVMNKKKVDLFTSAADVISMDGCIINKVGTFQIALAAKYWGIPYYVTGTPDKAHKSYKSVKIENRDPELVTNIFGKKVVLDGVKGFYPAFDVTPPELCSGIVTDKGIFNNAEIYQYFQKHE